VLEALGVEVDPSRPQHSRGTHVDPIPPPRERPKLEGPIVSDPGGVVDPNPRDAHPCLTQERGIARHDPGDATSCESHEAWPGGI
jgi:hypothetical protein